MSGREGGSVLGSTHSSHIPYNTRHVLGSHSRATSHTFSLFENDRASSLNCVVVRMCVPSRRKEFQAKLFFLTSNIVFCILSFWKQLCERSERASVLNFL
jgi:hypothetical protein